MGKATGSDEYEGRQRARESEPPVHGRWRRGVIGQICWPTARTRSVVCQLRLADQAVRAAAVSERVRRSATLGRLAAVARWRERRPAGGADHQPLTQSSDATILMRSAAQRRLIISPGLFQSGGTDQVLDAKRPLAEAVHQLAAHRLSTDGHAGRLRDSVIAAQVSFLRCQSPGSCAVIWPMRFRGPATADRHALDRIPAPSRSRELIYAQPFFLSPGNVGAQAQRLGSRRPEPRRTSTRSAATRRVDLVEVPPPTS